jgi:hypothetical protein
MADFTFEQLEILMTDDRINGKPINIDDYGFSRQFGFNVDGADYEIKWFRNQSTLTSGFLMVKFHHAEISNTWPNNSKMNIQFYDERNEVVAVLPIEWR